MMIVVMNLVVTWIYYSMSNSQPESRLDNTGPRLREWCSCNTALPTSCQQWFIWEHIVEVEKPGFTQKFADSNCFKLQVLADELLRVEPCKVEVSNCPGLRGVVLATWNKLQGGDYTLCLNHPI